MTGKDVEMLQMLLNHHLGDTRVPLVVDGIFGPLTKKRTIEFQTVNRLYPTKLPNEVPTAAKKPLAIDGIVGQHTLLVLLDTREINTKPGANFTPRSDESSNTSTRSIGGGSVSGRGSSVRRLTAGTEDDPTPIGPPPAKTFRLVQFSGGPQVAVNPWTFSPFVFTGQISVLAKNNGRPDFLLTLGGQAAMNDGGASGRWTGQLFAQMGLGGFPKLFGKLDLLNPFVVAMINQNLSKNFKPQPGTVGLGIGNQMTWTLASRDLPGAPGDKQDTVSLFLNTQIVTNIDLTNGSVGGDPKNPAPPGGQFLIGSIFTFF